MSTCPSETTIAGYATGRLEQSRVDLVTEHVDACASCFHLLTEVVRTTCESGDPNGAPPGHVLALADGVPRRIEEYHLLRRIGQGAMGQVFLAVDLRLDRPVAIKLLTRETREAARARFLVEARAVARLSHANVVTIHRVGELGQQPFLVYEFVRGRSLDQVAKPLPWPRAREVALALARGLAAAHRAGVLHRDIKPANVILGEDGVVKLLDFGLAKLGEVGARDYDEEPARDAPLAPTPSASLTQTGALMGTPLYMAPEAWLGEPASERMDLYSLGAVAYELCTGKPLHAGHTLDQVKQAAFADPVPLAQRVPGIDARFASAIDGCLARDPGARHASAEALCTSLERSSGRAPWARARRLAGRLSADRPAGGGQAPALRP